MRAYEIGSRDQLDSAKQKVSPIRKSQIELSSQLARHSRSRIVVGIKGKDLDKPSQVSCGTYSRPLIAAPHFRSSALHLVLFFPVRCYPNFSSFPRTIFVFSLSLSLFLSLSLSSFLPSFLLSSLPSFLSVHRVCNDVRSNDRSNPSKDILLSASTYYRRITVIRAAWN